VQSVNLGEAAPRKRGAGQTRGCTAGVLRKSAQTAEKKSDGLPLCAEERNKENFLVGDAHTSPIVFASVRKELKIGEMARFLRVWFVKSVRRLLNLKEMRESCETAGRSK
jgi:hypothetical protein